MKAAEVTDLLPGRLRLLEKEMQGELRAILDYWKQYVLSPDRKSFHASVNNHNIPDNTASKGLVMHARICWAFSSAYNITQSGEDMAMAATAYHYIRNNFYDTVYDGYYWSLDAAGHPLETRKQVYGQAFCLYAFAALHKVSKNDDVLKQAISLFHLIEDKSRDREKGGYIEAFNRDWSPAGDLRLSAKDQNDRKTMNTHLHVIEAYAELYQAWPDEQLRDRIAALLQLFTAHFINPVNGELNLFFNDDWVPVSQLRSYGHDIEASWLLLHCAEVINDRQLVERFQPLSLLMKQAASEGIDTDGGLWYEMDPADGLLVREKHSWPQAEAVIGYLNAWQIGRDPQDAERAIHAWDFIKTFIRDKENGEWFWGVNADYSPMEKEKAGFWKCPYHNVRACLEVKRRIEAPADTAITF